MIVENTWKGGTGPQLESFRVRHLLEAFIKDNNLRFTELELSVRGSKQTPDDGYTVTVSQSDEVPV